MDVIAPLGPMGPGRGKRRTFSSSLPAPKVLAKASWAYPCCSLCSPAVWRLGVYPECGPPQRLPASPGSRGELSQHAATLEGWRGVTLSTRSC